MSENNPWKKVGTYVADICLDDGDMIDVDVCLRTEVDAARATEATQHQQEIAAKDAEIAQQARSIKALYEAEGWRATALREEIALRTAVEAERDNALKMAEANAQTAEHLSCVNVKLREENNALLAAAHELRAERDRLKAALERLTVEMAERSPNDHVTLVDEVYLVARAAVEGEGTKP